MKGFLDGLVQKAKMSINNKLLDLQYGKQMPSPLPQDQYEKQGYRKVSQDGKPLYVNPSNMAVLVANQAKAQEQIPEIPPEIGQVQGVQAPIETKQYRHPNWDKWSKQAPKSFEALLSGTQQASEKHGVPQDLLMDISGIETSGGQFMDQLSGGPGKGFFQFEEPPIGTDPYSATASADLAAREIKNKRLSRWGTPKSNWGSLDATIRDPRDRLSTYYGKEELNKYLVPKYQFQD